MRYEWNLEPKNQTLDVEKEEMFSEGNISTDEEGVWADIVKFISFLGGWVAHEHRRYDCGRQFTCEQRFGCIT